MDSPRRNGGRGNSRGSGSSAPNSPRAGGNSFPGGGSSRGFRGGGVGGSPRVPPPEVVFLSRPDPYKLPMKPTNKLGCNWKILPVNRDEIELYQKRGGDDASWKKSEVSVSLNHYLIESRVKPGSFPIPSFYHYDITYEMQRGRDSVDSRPTSGGGHASSQLPTFGSLGIGGRGGRGRGRSMRGGGKGDGGGVGAGDGPSPRQTKLPKHLTTMILDFLIPKLRQKYKHYAIATDGSGNLYSTRKLEDLGIPSEHLVSFDELRQAKLMDECDTGAVKVTISATLDDALGGNHVIDTSSLATYFASNRSSLDGLQIAPELRCTMEAAFNSFVKTMPNFPYYSVGRSSMVPKEGAEEAELGNNLVAKKGIAASVQLGWKPYLNVDIANCAFLIGQPVLDALKNLVRDPLDVSRWSQRDIDDANALLRTCKVSYKVDNQKRGGPIRNVPKLSPSSQKFMWTEKNKEVSVFSYYKERYGLTLRHPKAPLLELRKAGTYVPAELCVIKDGQSYNRKLDGDQTTKMIDFARKSPSESYSAIQCKMTSLKLDENQVLADLGISVSSKMVQMKARVLVPPSIRYGTKPAGNDAAHISPTDGTWDCWRQDFNFYEAAVVKRWGILVVGCPKYQRQDEYRKLADFSKSLLKNGGKKGIRFLNQPEPTFVDPKDRRRLEAAENATDFEEIFKTKFHDCELVVCVLPRKGDSLYGPIKHAAEVGAGLLTQCVVDKNVSNLKDATIQNILFKINAKLGGINHVVVPPLDPAMTSKFSTVLMDYPVLILGADVTHAPPGCAKTLDDGSVWIMPSYVAVTGSLNRTGIPFMTEVKAQRKPNAGAAEVIERQHFVPIVKKMLDCFRSKAGQYPAKIIYYRDGVGDGQFKELLHVELTAMREACTQVKDGYQPKITFVTVQKRHKTRIFQHVGNRIDNAPAGTVIDKQIIHQTEVDFYLLSHKGLLGTSRPSRYHVLWDDSEFTQDELQSITYTMCYMYARCTKSVKMPAPTYYAHLAADRAKKLCEGFEKCYGPPSEENLNKILMRASRLVETYPMHFV